MVSSVLTESSVATTLVTTSSDADTGKDVRGEKQRLMTALQSARAELQCTTCEEDKADLEAEIKDLQSQIRKLQASETREPAGRDDRRADEAAALTGQPSREPPAEGNGPERIEQEAADAAQRFDIADPSTWTNRAPSNPWQPGQFLNLNA